MHPGVPYYIHPVRCQWPVLDLWGLGYGLLGLQTPACSLQPPGSRPLEDRQVPGLYPVITITICIWKSLSLSYVELEFPPALWQLARLRTAHRQICVNPARGCECGNYSDPTLQETRANGDARSELLGRAPSPGASHSRPAQGRGDQ